MAVLDTAKHLESAAVCGRRQEPFSASGIEDQVNGCYHDQLCQTTTLSATLTGSCRPRSASATSGRSSHTRLSHGRGSVHIDSYLSSQLQTANRGGHFWLYASSYRLHGDWQAGIPCSGSSSLYFSTWEPANLTV